jgi:hypothetical protein
MDTLMTPKTAREALKAAVRRVIATGQPQAVNGWTVTIRTTSHRFGVSRWWVLASRSGATVTEIQGMDIFAARSAKFARHIAPEAGVDVRDIYAQFSTSTEVK